MAAAVGTMYISPAQDSYVSGTNITVAIQEESGSNPVNAVQTALTYDHSQLEFVSVSEGTAFPVVAATSTETAGVVRIARGVNLGTTGATGNNVIAMVTFKVLAASGQVDIGIDSSSSLIMRSTDNTNIMTSAVGGSYSVTEGSPSTMYIDPRNGTYSQNATIAVDIRANSSYAVSSAQAVLKYSASQLQYIGISNGTAFPFELATDTAAVGTVKVARGVAVGASGVTGDNTVATVNFKVLAASGTTNVSIDDASSLIVRSADSINVMTGSAGASYTIADVAPALTSVSPTSGTTAGGTELTITGSNFVSDAKDITVTNSNGKSITKAAAYTYTVPGDANNDGRINGIDYSILAVNDGKNFPAADFNSDGVVGAADLAILLSAWTW